MVTDEAGHAMSPFHWRDFYTPRSFSKAALDLARHAAGFFSSVSPIDDWSVASLELQNKLTAFGLFEHIDLELKLRGEDSLSLPAVLLRADSLGPYYRLWATEGLGHYYADRHIAAGLRFTFLSDHDSASEIPEHSMVPLHAGVGLAIAECLLSAMEPEKCRHSTKTIRLFLEICRSNVQTDYREIAYEALGLAARNLYPQSIDDLQRGLLAIDPELVEYFWHGIGRAIYFSPSSFSPHRNAPWKGFQTCLQEPAQPSSRRNAVAGYAWALTLVNIRHPEIMASFLKHHGAKLEEEDAFYNGVCAALIIWRLSAGNDSYFRSLRGYRPPDASLISLWNRFIVRACDEAVEFCDSRRGEVRPGMLFREFPVSQLLTYPGYPRRTDSAKEGPCHQL